MTSLSASFSTFRQTQITVDFELSWVWSHPCFIDGITPVLPTVSVTNRRYDQDGCARSNHCCGYAWLRTDDISFEAPGYGYRRVTMRHNTSQLCKGSSVNRVRPKTEGNNPWRICRQNLLYLNQIKIGRTEIQCLACETNKPFFSISLKCDTSLTIDFQFSWVSDWTSRVHGSAGVDSGMPITDAANDQNASSGSNHGCSQWRFWWNDSSLQRPSYSQWLISFSNWTSDLSKASLIHNISWKAEWSNLRRFWSGKVIDCQLVVVGPNYLTKNHQVFLFGEIHLGQTWDRLYKIPPLQLDLIDLWPHRFLSLSPSF